MLLVPQYLMIVSYKIGSIFGLLQIHMTKRRWIDIVVSFLVVSGTRVYDVIHVLMNAVVFNIAK